MDKICDNLLCNPDKDMVDTVMMETEEGASYFTDVANKIVTEYVKDLDDLMIKVYNEVVTKKPSDDKLEELSLELNNHLYFIGDRMEKMGIRDDLSKLASKEVYNQSYLDYQSSAVLNKEKRTVAELTALSEADSKYETIMNSIYSRAYKQIKYKVDAAYEMLNTMKKIITKRLQENQLAYGQKDNLYISGSEE